MAIKPTIANARFADGGGADVAAPSSGLRTTGFVAATLIVQSLVNYLLNQFYQWALYLSDGALSGDHSINGALLVGKQTLVIAATPFTADNTTEIFTATAHGLQTGDGPARVATSVTLPAGLVAGTDYWIIRIDANTFRLATTFLNAIAGTFLLISTNGTGTQTIFSTGSTVRPTDLEVSRNLTVDGSFTASGGLTGNGLITANAGITVPTGQAVALNGTATLTVAGVTTASGGITTPSGVTYTGAADEHHPDRQIGLGPSSFVPTAASVAGGAQVETISTASPVRTYLQTWRFGTVGDLLASLQLRSGCRIKTITVRVASPNTGSTNSIAVSLDITNGTSSHTSAAGGFSSGISSEIQAFAINPSYTLVDGDVAGIAVSCADVNAVNAMHLVSASVVYDRP